ncbi:MAG TPA: hypothetical protein VF941_03340 [Clostridia bacterium]
MSNTSNCCEDKKAAAFNSLVDYYNAYEEFIAAQEANSFAMDLVVDEIQKLIIMDEGSVLPSIASKLAKDNLDEKFEKLKIATQAYECAEEQFEACIKQMKNHSQKNATPENPPKPPQKIIYR